MDNLIIFCTHHKTGTVLFKEILKEISKEFQFKLQICNQSELCDDTHIWFEWHSNVDFEQIKRPYRCIHIIRDPRDVVVSGYFYHLRCEEDWCITPRADFNNRSYQDILKSLDQDKGIKFEMKHIAKMTIEQMLCWNYKNKYVLELKFEYLMLKYKRSFKKIFKHVGFPRHMIPYCLEIADRHNINKFPESKIKKIKHIHSKGLNKWKQYFTEKHKRDFKESLGDSLIELDYEKNYNW